MILKEDNYQEKINSFSELEWKPLIEFIPIVENTKKFGELNGGEKIGNNVFTIPYWNQEEIVSQFIEIVYKIPIIIDFNWGAWDEGRKITREENFDFDAIDIPTKCKLITAIIRNDRFCDGVLVSAFESGLILKILKSIKKQLT